MVEIKELNQNISYFTVPYKDIFVGVYVVQTDNGILLFDTAAMSTDVEEYIVPALESLGVRPKYIFISHNHWDHAGGLPKVKEIYPEAIVVTRDENLAQKYENSIIPKDGDFVLDYLQVVEIPGHTGDSAAIFDKRTNTLISGDCLQSYGIYGSGEWYGAIYLPAEHLKALKKLRTMPIETIATAHDYHPVGMISCGADEVALRLDSCVDALERIRNFIEANSDLSDEEIASICNQEGCYPKVSARVVCSVRKAIVE